MIRVLAFAGARDAIGHAELSMSLEAATTARGLLDRLLVETDAPYLAPHPHRDKRNEPANVILTGTVLATVRGLPVHEVGELTTANARRLFRLGRQVFE